MADIATMKAIIDNVQTVAQSQGIKFNREAYEDANNIPASLIPFGKVFYKGLVPENTHGQRASYAELELLLKVILKETDTTVMMRKQLEWTDKLRDSMTVNALNIDELSASQLISKVTTDTIEVENRLNISELDVTFLIRYREA